MEIECLTSPAPWDLKYFGFFELATREKPFIVQIAPGFGDYPGFGPRIDRLRELWGRPLIVNSCCRTKAYNKAIGGNPRSFHVFDFNESDAPLFRAGREIHHFTLAIDLSETSEEFRKLAWDMGFSIGLGRGFTHIDDRYPIFGMKQTIFTY